LLNHQDNPRNPFFRLFLFVSKYTRIGKYALHDKWDTRFESELNLAVLSFYADEAYHRVFGSGKQLDEKSVLWVFIGLIVGRRLGFGYPLITMRKGSSVKALLAGDLNIRPKEMCVLMYPIKLGMKLPNVKFVGQFPDASETINAYRKKYSAVDDVEYVGRTEEYMQLLHSRDETASADTVFFSITMIAVHPEERGRGHLRAMLNRLISNLKKNTQAEYIQVSTYDESKVEMYQHLDFSVSEEMERDGIKAWVLTMPII